MLPQGYVFSTCIFASTLLKVQYHGNSSGLKEQKQNFTERKQLHHTLVQKKTIKWSKWFSLSTIQSYFLMS